VAALLPALLPPRLLLLLLLHWAAVEALLHPICETCAR
jgi:hypothetical protein